jgi:tetratricopeptide (TPR) repeat protein/tRNA A-37 threonylcarbamoyl transferase component Bud32
MKTFSPGLSDSIASVIADPPPCRHCDSSSHVAGGLCVGCLLQAGLDPGEVCEPEELVSAFAEISLPDKNWRLGNYEILEEIGRGGMGVIYRARQRHSRRIVAVKRVLSYHSDSRETLARFRREAQAAASLDHPNILPIYEVSESEDGLPFFSMKFAPGGSLQEVGPALRTDPRQCVALVARVARAVQYAHGKGILHRDLKPGNILLDGRGEPLVSDFGLAKWLDTTSDLTRTLTIFGTPGYIAPEQASGAAAQLKPTADVYSLGAILFDLLAGRPPFLGAHALSVIRQAAESPAPKLRTLSKLADRDLETICSRCLERDPKLRYPSAHDLAEDLERWLEGRSLIARPVLPPVRLWRWTKRNPKFAGSLATIVILGGIGLTAVVMGSRLSSIVQKAELARRSVVVTAFEDLDDLSTTSKSARAVTEAFTTALTHAKKLQVSSPVGKMTEEIDPWRPEDWKKIGESSGARVVLSGSVRRRAGKQRVVIHLIETATGSVVTTSLEDANSYADTGKGIEAKISNVLGLTKTLTSMPSDSLTVTDVDVNAVGGTNNASARSYYERGKKFFFRENPTDLVRAIDSFRKALELDPNYAQAHALLATACQHRATSDPGGKWLEQAESATATALRIAPLLPEAYQAQAGNLEMRGRFQESIDPHLIAYELDPADGRAAAMIGYIYNTLGRPDLGLLWFEKAARRETQPLYADNIGDAWADLGDYDRAETAFKTAAVFRPDLPVGPLGLSALALYRGHYESARKQCEEARAKYAGNPQPLMMAAVIEFFSRHFDAAEKFYREACVANREGGVDFLGSVRFLSALGFIRRHAGAETEGNALLKEAQALEEKELISTSDNLRRLYSQAANYAALGNREGAMRALDQAINAGWIDHRSMELDPRFDSIRETQPFKDILTGLTKKVEAMRRHLPGRQLASNPN